MSRRPRPLASSSAALALAAATSLALLVLPATRAADTDWPEPGKTARPWTRWWWLGSAVDATNLTLQLTALRDAGLGGVEICPIYGAKGAEDRFLRFLSPDWDRMLAHTLAEAERLGLGVDLTTGTGWPFGGPQVAEDDASSRLNLRRYALRAGERLTEPLPRGQLLRLLARPESGPPLDLTASVREGKLDWTAPTGSWRLYAASRQTAVQKVKRAAPGGEGYVLDPFSPSAMDRYLQPFSKALDSIGPVRPRAHFHDSFEYYGASWTPEFAAEFSRRRGYDLWAELPALLDNAPADLIARVKSDYRETLAELHLEYLRHWTGWAHSRQGLSRSQAHGGPGNLLDAYAAADIPEIEIFRHVDDRQVPFLMLAASAAHLCGHNLVSAESFTWLGEHFQVTLADLKPAADLLFLAGVNHLFFHGTPYSPADVPWPGWLFYASTHLGPAGGLWRDLPAFNNYLTRCQSLLQFGQPDADVLLWLPWHDLWAEPEGLVRTFTVHNQEQWFWPSPAAAAARALQAQGCSFDYASDSLLAQARVEDRRIVAGNGRYRALLLPRARLIAPDTLRHLLGLARQGATLLVEGDLPEDVPGLARLDERRDALRQLRQSIPFENAETAGLQRASLDGGQVLRADQLHTLLQAAALTGEPMAHQGLSFLRRAHAGGHLYFIVNRSATAFDDWVTLATPAQGAVLLDPLHPGPGGVARLSSDTGPARLRLRLEPGQSCFLRTFANRPATGPPALDLLPAGAPRMLTGPWRVDFLSGGPALPAAYSAEKLGSWTEQADPEARRFAGTARYRLQFEHTAAPAAEWRLDLGKVCESARVLLNGRPLGTVFCAPFAVWTGDALQAGKNTLEIEVTNLAANRIADLDRRGVPWKAFHEINFVNIDYKPFDASGWPARESGLLGPVTLTPLRAAGAPAP